MLWVLDNEEEPTLILKRFNWTAWIVEPGYPPTHESYQTEELLTIEEIAEIFINLGGVGAPQNWRYLLELPDYYKKVFVNYLLLNKERLSLKLFTSIDRHYNFSGSTNLEFQSKWYQVAIYSRNRQYDPVVEQFLGSTGRASLIAPIYEAYLAKSQKTLACRLYHKYYAWYTKILNDLLEQQLDC